MQPDPGTTAARGRRSALVCVEPDEVVCPPTCTTVLAPSAAAAVRDIPNLSFPIHSVATLRTLRSGGTIVVLPGLHLGRRHHCGTVCSRERAGARPDIEPIERGWKDGIKSRANALAAFVDRMSPNVVVFGGDTFELFERGSERLDSIVKEWAVLFTAIHHRQADMIFLRGNHDAKLEESALLKSLERAGALAPPALAPPGTASTEHPVTVADAVVVRFPAPRDDVWLLLAHGHQVAGWWAVHKNKMGVRCALGCGYTQAACYARRASCIRAAAFATAAAAAVRCDGCAGTVLAHGSDISPVVESRDGFLEVSTGLSTPDVDSAVIIAASDDCNGCGPQVAVETAAHPYGPTERREPDLDRPDRL